MKALVAVLESVTRDQIRVGLQGFGDIDAEYATGLSALDEARRRDFDFAIVGLESQDAHQEDLVDQLQQECPDIEIVVVAGANQLKALRMEKARRRLFACLSHPIEPLDFFRTVNRLRRNRRTASHR